MGAESGQAPLSPQADEALILWITAGTDLAAWVLLSCTYRVLLIRSIPMIEADKSSPTRARSRLSNCCRLPLQKHLSLPVNQQLVRTYHMHVRAHHTYIGTIACSTNKINTSGDYNHVSSFAILNSDERLSGSSQIQDGKLKQTAPVFGSISSPRPRDGPHESGLRVGRLGSPSLHGVACTLFCYICT